MSLKKANKNITMGGDDISAGHVLIELVIH